MHGHQLPGHFMVVNSAERTIDLIVDPFSRTLSSFLAVKIGVNTDVVQTQPAALVHNFEHDKNNRRKSQLHIGFLHCQRAQSHLQMAKLFQGLLNCYKIACNHWMQDSSYAVLLR